MGKNRKMGSKKFPRKHMLVFKVPKETKVDGIRFNPQTGGIQLMHGGVPIPMIDTQVQVSYDRQKGQKVIVRAPVNPANASIHPDAHLLTYATVFSVDTNTAQVNGVSVSITCCIQFSIGANNSQISADVLGITALELHNVTRDPERIGWYYAIDRIARNIVAPTSPIGVVVDSSLDILEKINKHEAPVVDDWFLPSGVTLLFASDAAVDSIANKFIRQCDTIATRILENIALTGSDVHLESSPAGSPFTHYRCWSAYFENTNRDMLTIASIRASKLTR